MNHHLSSLSCGAKPPAWMTKSHKVNNKNLGNHPHCSWLVHNPSAQWIVQYHLAHTFYKKPLPIPRTLLAAGTGVAPQASRRLWLAYLHQPGVKCAVGEAGRHLRGLQRGAAGVQHPAAGCPLRYGCEGNRKGAQRWCAWTPSSRECLSWPHQAWRPRDHGLRLCR